MAETRTGMEESSSDCGTSSPPVLPRSNTMPGGIDNSEKVVKTSTPTNFERSKTERRKVATSSHEKHANQLFDDKISVKKKLKMLNRIATVKDDGTVVVDIPSNLEPSSLDIGEDLSPEVADDDVDSGDIQYRPPMHIVILIVGTRGDVQTFVAIGKLLQDYGHRVRLATHANFKEFVLTAGLEFYPLGGDPKVLAEYMVKNKGFLPSAPSEIPTQRKQIKDIIFSLLAACKDPDEDTGIPFKADAIIANPPAYGHVHVAEALKVPIHTAQDRLSGHKNAIVISKHNADLTPEEIQKMVEEAARYKAEDEYHKARVSLKDFADKVKAMAKDPGLSALENKSMEEAADNVISWLDTNHHADIDDIHKQRRELENTIRSLMKLKRGGIPYDHVIFMSLGLE